MFFNTTECSKVLGKINLDLAGELFEFWINNLFMLKEGPQIQTLTGREEIISEYHCNDHSDLPYDHLGPKYCQILVRFKIQI